ncbi:MAG TPA: UDP-3-O-acyl-N-acetylglucosamine deacetylase [Pirellulales bacterium]|jgi:UDP-3-O-acyl N-acetylglucosamine deacetylase|nr:UDP-3-O-acyl-N-acetylglucosamine deacetylase [Pirellulales bacterium]
MNGLPLIHAQRQQRTIREPVSLSGFGYWSGRDVQLEFRPGAEHSGIVFVRTDLARRVRIPALVGNRFETPRRTTLKAQGATVEMTEHVLAALWGLQIDNCEIWVDQPELPGCDGSSQPFVECLDGAGVVEQNAERSQLVVREITRVGNEESWIEARPAPRCELSLRYRLDYGLGNGIGRQTLQLPITPETFREELAPCRTFMLKSEADWLLEQGLGKRATLKDLLIFDANGPIDNELRFRDECVRHKMLDLVGDLALAGCDLIGHISAHRSGHRLNAELVRALLTECQRIENRRRSA